MTSEWVQKAESLTIKVENFVGGRTLPGHGAIVNKRSPRDGKSLCQFYESTVEDVDNAVVAAKTAFVDKRWVGLSPQSRKDILCKLAWLIDRHREELSLLECLDVGKPINDAINFDLPAAASIIRFNAEAIDKVYGTVFGVDSSNLSYQLKRPLGVVAALVGWNFPIVLAATKIGPILATGNSLVLKPSEITSFSALRLAKLALEAGVPEGIFNVVNGGAEVGAALARHPDVDAVSFTGSTSTGKKLLVASGESNMKRLVLECGGKAPNIVFDDCPNIETVVEAVLARAFWNQGQVCTASSRLLVQSRIKDGLLSLISEKVAKYRSGDPLLPNTRYGAVVSDSHKNKILRYVECGEREGAKIWYRGDERAPFPGGSYVSPVIFHDVKPQSRIAQEEIFGPVLSVISFDSEEDAVRISNDTVYGLSAIIWTKDLGRAIRLTHEIHAGIIVVNATESPGDGPAAGVLSVGGHKQSGFGFEGGVDGLHQYLSSTAVQLFA